MLFFRPPAQDHYDTQRQAKPRAQASESRSGAGQLVVCITLAYSAAFASYWRPAVFFRTVVAMGSKTGRIFALVAARLNSHFLCAVESPLVAVFEKLCSSPTYTKLKHALAVIIMCRAWPRVSVVPSLMGGC